MRQKITRLLIFTMICFLTSSISTTISFFAFRGARSAEAELDKKKVFEEAFNKAGVKPEVVNNAETEGDRINFVIAGIDGKACDAIILSSFHTKKRKMDLFVIPSNTYYKLSGGSSTKIDKLGDTYAANGIVSLQTAVDDLVEELASNFYIVVDYKGFEAIINEMGGVPISIPQKMQYEDSYAKPPLIISFAPGNYTLNGRDSLKYIRYLNGNGTGVMQRGDTGRIEALKSFLEKAFEKAYSLKLPALINTGYKHVKSNINPGELASLTTSIVGMKLDDIRIHTIPGYYTDGQYYVIDKEILSEKLKAIFDEN